MQNTIEYPTINHPIRANLDLPGSKSITNRALLIAGLANGSSLLKNVLASDDTDVMRISLTNLGVSCQRMDSSTFKIDGCRGQFSQQEVTIQCADAGTVLRFLLPACAYQTGVFKFQASPQLMRRPSAPLLRVLMQQGVHFNFLKAEHELPLTVDGNSMPFINRIHIPGDLSSQFLSGLILASPLTKTDMLITTEHMISEPYVTMTCKIMSHFGVVVDRLDNNTFHISPNQTYQANSYSIEPDLSTASYFFAAAALTNGQFTLKNIDRSNCLQGDIYFLNILEQMGCTVHTSNRTITVIGCPQLNGISVNIKHCSDLFMTIACLCAFAKEPSIISGIKHIRLKESDRIKATKENLARLGVRMLSDETNDKVTILPAPIRSAVLKSYSDHRMVMAFALCGLKQPGIIMEQASCVAKTCPEFINLWNFIL